MSYTIYKSVSDTEWNFKQVFGIIVLSSVALILYILYILPVLIQLVSDISFAIQQIL